MAERNRQRGIASDPGRRRAKKKATVRHTAKSGRSVRQNPKELSVRTASPAGFRLTDAGVLTQSGRGSRTPPSSRLAELEEIAFGSSPELTSGQRISATIAATEPNKGSVQTELHETGMGRTRTSPPLPIPGELEEITLGSAQVTLGERRQRRGNRTDRFQHIQDFLHHPSLFDLRGKEIETSSTPEEIESRKGEIQYQIQVIRTLMTVLTEELEALEQARPQSREAEL